MSFEINLDKVNEKICRARRHCEACPRVAVHLVCCRCVWRFELLDCLKIREIATRIDLTFFEKQIYVDVINSRSDFSDFVVCVTDDE